MRSRAPCLVLFLASCTADDPIDKDKQPDAAPSDDLPAPELEAIPERTPRTTVGVSGRTEGTRVVGLGSPGGTLVTVVLPGGSFCQVTPIATEGTTAFRIYAMAGDGRVSDAVPVEVTYDPDAADTGNSCGEPGPDCGDAEVCGGDDRDDDCNGWADDCDLTCSGCQDDAFEPNDFPVNVPTVSPGSYPMELCPCRDDWFAFQAQMGERIHAVIDFDHDAIDIDAKLYLSGPEGHGITEPPVASANGTTDQEVIDHSAEMAGVYFLRVFPFRDADDPAGSYSIAID